MINISSHQRTANQNFRKIPLHTHWDDCNEKRQIITSIGKDVDKLDSFYTAGVEK
jgi:hypothetical protein